MLISLSRRFFITLLSDYSFNSFIVTEIVIAFFRLKGEARNLRYNVRDGGHTADSLHGKKTECLNPRHLCFILQVQTPPSPVDFYATWSHRSISTAAKTRSEQIFDLGRCPLWCILQIVYESFSTTETKRPSMQHVGIATYAILSMHVRILSPTTYGCWLNNKFTVQMGCFPRVSTLRL